MMLSCCLKWLAVCPFKLYGNHIDGFEFIILAKQLKRDQQSLVEKPPAEWKG